MKDYELRVKVAELRGWTNVRILTIGQEFWGVSPTPNPTTGKSNWTTVIPDYPQDLNAMHEAEEDIVGDVEKELRYLGHLDTATKTNKLGMFRATARQRAEAFVKTMEAVLTTN